MKKFMIFVVLIFYCLISVIKGEEDWYVHWFNDQLNEIINPEINMKIGTLCYITDSEKTLMLHRVKKENDMHEGKWNGLGGKLEAGESPEECVIREVYEESGLTIKNPKLKGIITFPKFNEIDDWLVFVYTANDFQGNTIDSDEGVLEWIHNSKLLDLNLWEGDKVYLKWLDKNELFSAKFIYKKRKLVDFDVVFYE